MVVSMSLDCCCGRPKMINSVSEGLEEVGRHPVGYISYSVFKISDVMR